MHIILWKFTVREERIQEFVGAYGSDGDWAQLFSGRLAHPWRFSKGGYFSWSDESV
jgi:hypothetical protein